MNYGYVEATIGADQVMLYKLICRQVANRLDMTASFLPKPVTGVNGNGMHTNISVGRGDTNLFYDAGGKESLSDFAWQFVDRLLTNALDLCLVYNSSVNAYRRLDPHFEAPNQIKASPIDRGSMVRIPIGNKRSARIEMRSIAPDSNPYLAIYSLLRTGLDGPLAPDARSASGDPARQHLRRDRGAARQQLRRRSPRRRGARQVRRLEAGRPPTAARASSARSSSRRRFSSTTR